MFSWLLQNTPVGNTDLFYLLRRTLYAYHFLPREIAARDTSNDRPSIKMDGYYDYDVNFYYTIAQQTETIGELVGSAELADQYVRDEENVYLARGHLSPNADFVYYSFQVASSNFKNFHI